MTESLLNADEFQQPRERPILHRIVRWSILIGVFIVLLAFLLAPRRYVREAAQRLRCGEHLRVIGLALRQYQDDWGAIPPAYTVDAKGNRLHSWRSLLLPYLGQQELYDRIDFSKPWNDPANSVVRQTPLDCFRCPTARIRSNHTSYGAAVGEEYAFSPKGPRQLSEFIDDTGATIALMELPVEGSFEWMEPRDADEKTLSLMARNPSGHHHRAFNVWMVEGFFRSISEKVSPEQCRALLTISTGDDAGEKFTP